MSRLKDIGTVKQPSLDIAITIADPAWRSAIPSLRALARRAVTASLKAAGHRLGPSGASLSLVFADDATVRDLNRTYRKQDKPTNVLSFAAHDAVGSPALPPGCPDMLGDVILAYETVAREAVDQGKTMQDHTLHLVVHGVLHLLGHDHIKAPEAKRMETLEIDILAGMAIANPYLSPDIVTKNRKERVTL